MCTFWKSRESKTQLSLMPQLGVGGTIATEAHWNIPRSAPCSAVQSGHSKNTGRCKRIGSSSESEAYWKCPPAHGSSLCLWSSQETQAREDRLNVMSPPWDLQPTAIPRPKASWALRGREVQLWTGHVRLGETHFPSKCRVCTGGHSNHWGCHIAFYGVFILRNKSAGVVS